jgi:tripartite-type tricarboxylate transporter receptor subunit TctC
MEEGMRVAYWLMTMLLGALLAAAGAHAQQKYPSRPVRVVVPVAAGGAVDLVSRLVAERLSSALGQQVVVDNRPGAASIIGLEMVARANPDGYTLIATSDTMALLPSMHSKLPFDPETSFSPIVLMTTQPLVLAVSASVPAAGFKEFVALSKARPGTLSFGSGSALQHLTGELIKRHAGIDMVHVPYKGGGQAIIDLTGGQLPAAVLGSSTVIPQARGGKVRILAVTSAARSPALPNVPTLLESGLAGFDVYQWIILLAPAKTPQEVIARLNGETARALQQPSLREKLEAAGLEPRTGSPQEVQTLIHRERVRWAKLIKELGLKPD